MHSLPSNDTASVPLHVLVAPVKLADGADADVYAPQILAPFLFTKTSILLPSKDVSTRPLTSLPVTLMLSNEEPVPHFVVLASGLAGKEMVMPVTG